MDFGEDADEGAGGEAGGEAGEEAGEEAVAVMFGRDLPMNDMILRTSKYYVRPSTFDWPSHLKTVVI